jgi:hypothetical protein
MQPGATSLGQRSSEVAVLLVAADPFRAVLIEEALADVFAVHRVSGERAALSMVNQIRFDVCVIDETPGLLRASPTLTSRLRRAQPGIPIVLCSREVGPRPAGLLTVAEPLVAGRLRDAVDHAITPASNGVNSSGGP